MSFATTDESALTKTHTATFKPPFRTTIAPAIFAAFAATFGTAE